jgi:hypothetical protein
MKKSFFKKTMILCFAVFGMVMIGNNVFATDPDPDEYEEPGDGSGGGAQCEMTQVCASGICSILNAKKRVFANGCKKACDYTCTVQSWPMPL